MKHKYLISFFLLVLIVSCATNLSAQVNSNLTAYHDGGPSNSYDEGPEPKIVSYNIGQKACLYDVKDLAGRKILNKPVIEMVSRETITLSFTITIGSDGTVKYVKPAASTLKFPEHRKGAINGLYDMKFSPASGQGSERHTVTVTFPAK